MKAKTAGILLAAGMLALGGSTGFGGIGLEWSMGGGWMCEYGGDVDNGPGVAEYHEVVWQLIYAGPDGIANDVDLNNAGWGWVSGDDVVLAERVIPAGGGTAADGTEWDEWLMQRNTVKPVYVDLEWSRTGCVYQRIYQGMHEGDGTYYFQTDLMELDTNYQGGMAEPWLLQRAYVDPDQCGVCINQVIWPGGMHGPFFRPPEPVDPYNPAPYAPYPLTDGPREDCGWADGRDGEDWCFRYVPSYITVIVLNGPSTGAVNVPEWLKWMYLGYYYYWYVTGLEKTFVGCTNLTSVTIPDSVVQIGTATFSGCSGLLSVVIGNKVESIGENAFSGCTSLPSVAIPNSVTNIGVQAFSGCTGLESVVIPVGVQSVGERAFEGCSRLTAIEVAAENAWYAGNGGVLFSKDGRVLLCCPAGKAGAYDVPEGVGKIGAYAFSGCAGLETVMISAGVQSVGDRAFGGCSRLTAIEVAAENACYAGNDGVLFSKDGTVLVCYPSGKAGVYDVPEGVREIGPHAFSGCAGLTTLDIPDGVTGVGYGAFSGCSGLVTLYVPPWWRGSGKLTNAGVPSGCRVVYGHPAFVGGVEWIYAASNGEATVIDVLASGGSVSVPAVLGGCPVTAIGTQAFCNCPSLARVAIPDSVTVIGSGAFSGCNGLVELYVPTWWRGIDKLKDAGVPVGCRVTYGFPQVVEGVEWLYATTNGQATVVGGPTNGSVAVPSVLGGCLVTAIGDSAFKDATGLTAVELPDEVRWFGDYAFSGCSGLRLLAVSDMVEHIGSYAFARVDGLTNLVILDSEAIIGDNAFSGSGLRLLEVPSEWRGTDKLSSAGRPAGCTVVYRESDLSITPETSKFGLDGGPGAIVTTGSGMWKATTDEEWITLVAARGRAGYPVVYMVGAATDVEPRTGVVFVNGQQHTVTQDGRGASISPASATFETGGGTGTVSVAAPDRTVWQARSNCSWLKVETSGGTGPGTLEYTVEAFGEVNTRQGTLTVAGNTFTVFQTGRRMQLASTSSTKDYLTHVIPVTVEALSDTTWAAKPNASWISVVDGGNGKGSDLVTIAISENPSWKARTGTVAIGTETFTVTQEGRTALEFDIDPKATTASVNGANGVIAVTATPDLPWSAESRANWLTVYEATAQGAGNGNVVYSASPNPTLYDRTGSIAVTPGDERTEGRTHMVMQPAATSALSRNGYEFEAPGENCEVLVTVPEIVQWQIENTNWWLKVHGETNRMGSGTVTLQTVPNDTVKARGGTVTIARKKFTVAQKGRNVELGYETKVFGPEVGSDTISVMPDGNVPWMAVASDPTWITIVSGVNGTGGGEIVYVVSPYVGDGEARTGTITVGDKVVYITQRAYAVAIEPSGALLEGNNGAGEFGVSAGIGEIWRAIATEPWITIIEGYNPVTGSGIVRFAYTDNDTGKTRTGKIIVSGEVYTLEQKAREVEAFPAAAMEDEVAGALEGSADPRLVERLETVVAYGEFRNWLEEKGMDPWTVKASAHAWPSFLLGADNLFENEPEIQIGGIALERGGAKSATSSTTLEIRVTVKDGETSVPVDAAKVAALFDAATTPGDWEVTPRLPVTATQTGTFGDTLLFRVSPGTGTEPAIFLRLSD